MKTPPVDRQGLIVFLVVAACCGPVWGILATRTIARLLGWWI